MTIRGKICPTQSRNCQNWILHISKIGNLLPVCPRNNSVRTSKQPHFWPACKICWKSVKNCGRNRSTTYRWTDTHTHTRAETKVIVCQNCIWQTIATITYRALHLQQPSYISSLLVNYVPPRTLRFTSQGLLNTPGSRTVIGATRFSSAAPVIWNKLPYTVRSDETIATFCTRLKTHLFPVIAS